MLGIIFAVCSYFSYITDSLDKIKYSHNRLKEAKNNGDFEYIDWYGDTRSVMTGIKTHKENGPLYQSSLMSTQYYENNIDKIIETLEYRQNKINEIRKVERHAGKNF